MTEEWSLHLPGEFRRRVEDGSLVLWKPGLTFWINVWGNNGETPDERLAWVIGDASPHRSHERVVRQPNVVLLTYELDESDAHDDTPCYRSLSGYVVGEPGHVQISAYCDDPGALKVAYAVIESIRLAA